MKIVSVINYKGGVGKTTITANLAASLATQGKNVLVIDLDPQANLTFSFVGIEEWKKDYKDKTIKSIFESFIQRTNMPKLSSLLLTPYPVNDCFKTGGEIQLLSSHLSLVNIDLELAINLGGGSSKQQRDNFLSVYSILKNSILDFLKESKRKYDIVLIDCPPNLNIVTKNAIVASDYYVIPAKPDYLSTLGIQELKLHINTLMEEYNENAEKSDGKYSKIYPQLAGVVFNMVSLRNGRPIEAQSYYVENVKDLEIPVFDTFISIGNTAYASAPEQGIPVCVNKAIDKKYVNELNYLMLEFAEKVGME